MVPTSRATFLLSSFNHALWSISWNLGTLNSALSVSQSPSLLTKQGPLALLIPKSQIIQVFMIFQIFEVREWTKANFAPYFLIVALSPETFSKQCCYPERNFDGNQQLGGSISLSPLYPDYRINLHVRILLTFHLRFRRLQSIQAKFTAFRVWKGRLKVRKKYVYFDPHDDDKSPTCYICSLSLRVFSFPLNHSPTFTTPRSVFRDG